MLCSLVVLALFASVQGRAVNISNTWVLPEEGFPVFYRYFRDRISWYEADAVCQFHHANLVTVDTTAQYDAVRAYLKELDISSAVWVGLIRSNPDGDFTWTDYRGLSGDGYWSSAPDARSAPLCAAADPSADYRWEARACGGPTVASFICELPVPQWASGNEGCMVRELPALTILYLPESAAVQLTADCGLAGVKRVQCTGNVKREDLLKNLSCDEDITTTSNLTPSSNAVTTDQVFVGQDTSTDITIEENTTTEHEDDINQPSSSSPQPSTTENIKHETPSAKLIDAHIFNNIILDKNIDLSNNMQSNYIPNIGSVNNYLTNEELDQIEDEKQMQHKMLHEEIARLGNPENIFTQPTDHFVPPLVMAKARISDDMTVLSLQEKHAQQLAEQQKFKEDSKLINLAYTSNNLKSTTEQTITTESNNKLNMQPDPLKHSLKKDKLKAVPKKYNEKLSELKQKILKSDLKPVNLEKPVHLITSQPEMASQSVEVTSTSTTHSLPFYQKSEDGPSLDLTVILKDTPDIDVDPATSITNTGDISRLEIVKNSTSNNGTEITLIDMEATENTKQDVPAKHFDEKIQNVTLNHEVIKITIISESHGTPIPTTVFEVTTKSAHSDDTTVNNVAFTLSRAKTDKVINTNEGSFTQTSTIQPLQTESTNTTFINETETKSDIYVTEQPSTNETLPTSTDKSYSTTTSNLHQVENTSVIDILETSTKNFTHDETLDSAPEFHDEYESNSTDSIDDFQSPLLSGASEPLRRPSRTRRPQPSPNRNKFNPFRILG